MKPYCTESKKRIIPSELDSSISYETDETRSFQSVKKEREEARFMRRNEKKRVRKQLDKELDEELNKYYNNKK